MHYDDFAIHLDRGPDGACRARVYSAAGGAVGPVEVGIDAAELEQLSLVFGQRVRGERKPVPDTGLDAALRAVGGRLFTSLFSAPIVHRFHHSLGGLGNEGSRGLRLRLQMSLDDPLVARLHGLPWELLFRAETDEFIALGRRLTIVRSVGLPVPIRRPPLSRPLRILVVASAPLGLPPLSLSTEVGRLKRAWEVRDEVEVEKLPQANLDCLRDALLQQEYHVLHFIGHGQFENETGEGSLLFEAGDGTPEPVNGQLLAQQLRDFPSLHLVFLNACQTAQSTAAGPFAGVATALLQAGIPAVLAMQFPMTDAAALIVSEMVYQRLADGDPIDAAVAEGRLAIKRRLPHSPEWGTPVLFLQAADGQLIRTETATARRQGRRFRLKPWIGAALLAAVVLCAWGGFRALGYRSKNLSTSKDPVMERSSGLVVAYPPPIEPSTKDTPHPAESVPAQASPPAALDPARVEEKDKPLTTLPPSHSERPATETTLIRKRASNPYQLTAGQPVYLLEIQTDAVVDFLSIQGENFARLTLTPSRGKSLVLPVVGPTHEPIELKTEEGLVLVDILTVNLERQILYLRVETK